jgi:hypothetical protein
MNWRIILGAAVSQVNINQSLELYKAFGGGCQ